LAPNDIQEHDMLRHIVFFSVAAEENREKVQKGLELLKTNPHKRHLEVGCVDKKLDAISEQVDFVVYGEFDDAEQLAAYKAHPVYQESIDLVRPLREMRVAADYVVPEAE
tara:strand:- start:1029 stop:1358 length:330 start_codon:yes stop_codon:yes gene_type:complete